jgi:hypothetical protein
MISRIQQRDEAQENQKENTSSNGSQASQIGATSTQSRFMMYQAPLQHLEFTAKVAANTVSIPVINKEAISIEKT